MLRVVRLGMVLLLLLLLLRRLLLLLGHPLLVLLQLLRGEEHLLLLAIRAGHHPVGLSFRSEVHLCALAATAAAAAAASTGAGLLATGLSWRGGAFALVGAFIALVIAFVHVGRRLGAGSHGGRQVSGIAVVGFAHGLRDVRRGPLGGVPRREAREVESVGQEARRGVLGMTAPAGTDLSTTRTAGSWSVQAALESQPGSAPQH
jgi:hypothetical protein